MFAKFDLEWLFCLKLREEEKINDELKDYELSIDQRLNELFFKINSDNPKNTNLKRILAQD